MLVIKPIFVSIQRNDNFNIFCSLDFDDQTLDPGPGMEHYAYEQVPFSPAPFMHHHPVFVVSPGKGFMFPNNPANENSDGNKKSLGKSRDDPLLRRLGIPRTVDEITTMTIEDFQRYIRPFTNEMQSYLKKIRRRGKNKIAARNSRARRESKGFTMEDQFETLQYEHESLLNAQNQVQNRIEEEKRISCDLLPETFDEITPIMDDGFEIFGTENNQNFNFYIGY